MALSDLLAARAFARIAARMPYSDAEAAEAYDNARIARERAYRAAAFA